MNLYQNTINHYKEISSVSKEGLAIFRFFCGISFAVTFLNLFFLSDPFFTPNPALFHLKTAPSIIDLMPNSTWVKLLFLFGSFSGMLLTLNIRPKLNTIFCILMFLSIQAKQDTIIIGSDIISVICLTWFLLLKNPHANKISNSLIIFAMRLQIVFVYLTAAVAKLHYASWQSGHSVLYYLSNFQVSTPLGKVLGSIFPHWVGQFFSYFTIAAEFIIFPAFLLPFFHPWFMRICVILLIGFHISTGFLLKLGMFPFLMTGMLLFLLDESIHKKIYNWAISFSSKLIPATAIDLFRMTLKSIVRNIFIFLLSITFLMEGWNALAGMNVHPLWIHYPWRDAIVSTVRYSQYWSMFTFPDNVIKKDNNNKLNVDTGLVLVAIYDNNQRTLIDPTTGQVLNWSYPFLTRQHRNSWLTQMVNAPHADAADWYSKLAVYYGRMAKSKGANPIQAAVYHYTTNLNVPTDAWDTYADLNKKIIVNVRLLASVDLDPNMNPVHITYSEDKSPIEINKPFFSLQ